MVIDTEYLAPANLAVYGVKTTTHHSQRFANILFSDGHAVSRPNADGRFTVNVLDYMQILNSFDKILQTFEIADTQP